MTEELERSRALMDKRFEELQAREDLLQTTINESVREALQDYIQKNPPYQPISGQTPLLDPKVSPVVARDLQLGIMPSHPIHSFILLFNPSAHLIFLTGLSLGSIFPSNM